MGRAHGIIEFRGNSSQSAFCLWTEGGQQLLSILVLTHKEVRAGDQKEVQHMSKYELAVVVNAQIDDEARTAVIDNCKALVEKFGGTITGVDDWGKKRLAYEIQKMNEGYYTFIHFDAEGSAIAEIEQRMRIMDNVIRYLCVKQNEA